jgi:hypothetical protein
MFFHRRHRKRQLQEACSRPAADTCLCQGFASAFVTAQDGLTLHVRRYGSRHTSAHSVVCLRFAPAALDELRVGLTALVTEGAEWQKNKWPQTQTRRPDLVSSLIATCIRQFGEGIRTPDLFRSSVLALRFTKSEHSHQQAPKDLRDILADASSQEREAAFWADDAFLQALHPIEDTWGRVFQLSHGGGVRLNPGKDRTWVLRRLADKNLPGARNDALGRDDRATPAWRRRFIKRDLSTLFNETRPNAKASDGSE